MDQDFGSSSRRFRDAHSLLANAVSREAVIEAIRATARTAFGSDGVTFVLRDGDLCHYIEEDAISPLWKGQRFPMSACISGWSMLNAQTAVIEDIYADPRIPHQAYRPTFVKSLIMTPVMSPPWREAPEGGDPRSWPSGQRRERGSEINKPVAAIGAYWASQRKFHELDIRTVQSVAKAVARAFDDLPAN
jgi:hypothetical protein